VSDLENLLLQNHYVTLSDDSYAVRLSKGQLWKLIEWAIVCRMALSGRPLELEPGDDWDAGDIELHLLLLRAHPDFDPDVPE
jgi:hypothetical protein